MKWIVIILILHSPWAFGLSERSRCLSADLKRQDCRLQKGKFKAQLSNKTISWATEIWQSVENLPLSGEGITWEKVILREVGNRLILQMWIWDAGLGESKVQSLHWYVFDFVEGKMQLRVDEVVRRRHSKMDDQGKTTFVLDPMEKHGIKTVLSKKKKIEWNHLKKTGEF